jgi:hypothetical protein
MHMLALRRAGGRAVDTRRKAAWLCCACAPRCLRASLPARLLAPPPERGAVTAADRPQDLVCSGGRGRDSSGDGVVELALLLLLLLLVHLRAARLIAAGACSAAAGLSVDELDVHRA